MRHVAAERWGSGLMVPSDTRWPSNFKLVPRKTHFSEERIKLASEVLRNSLFKLASCSSKSFPPTTTSSIYINEHSRKVTENIRKSATKSCRAISLAKRNTSEFPPATCHFKGRKIILRRIETELTKCWFQINVRKFCTGSPGPTNQKPRVWGKHQEEWDGWLSESTRSQ